MKRKFLKPLALMVLLITVGVLKGLAGTIIVTGPITSNTTWVNTNTYILVGYVYVKNNATLTINPGTLIQGDSATLGSLIITRGAKIKAIGTPCQPIVFTSEKPAGQRQRGDWGGVILLGSATINAPGDTAHIEGIVPVPETLYGGGKNPTCGGGDCPNDNDNSGNLEYVRIEFAGVALAPNNEINGLTMGGVGSGTTIDHVQVSYSNDDSYEWFGGKVNCKHLVAFRGLDDDFDTDNGFSGNVQFAVALRDPNVADVSKSHGFESDNDASGDNALPQTKAVFSNVTEVAGGDATINPLYESGVFIRRNSHMYAYNSIVMGWPAGIQIDGSSSQANTTADTLVQNCIITCTNPANYVTTTNPSGTISVIDLLQNHSSNSFYSGNASVLLSNPYALTAPDFQPTSSSPALSGASFSHIGLSGNAFFTHTTYIGAFSQDGTNDWTGDWTNWDPVNTNYTGKIDNTPTVTGVITNVICPHSGAVNITVTGGIPPYSYSWSNGATTEDISGLNQGPYQVTVFDAGGNCSKLSKNFGVKAVKPILTTCTSTSSSITVFRSGNVSGFVTGYQLRSKKHSSTQWGPFTNVGNGTSFTTTGLLANTQYDFQLRGICPGGGFTATSDILTCTTTAFRGSEISGTPEVNVYPNPTSGQLNIQLDGFDYTSTVNLKVINMLGQIVYTMENISIANSSDLQLNLSNLSDGLYTLEATDGVNRIVRNISVAK